MASPEPRKRTGLRWWSRSSRTCHDRPTLSLELFRLLGVCVVVVCSARTARAVDPGRTMSQYVHDRWGVESGFPRGPVYSIDQTKDGYLWIGTEKGLVRFDGLGFHLMQSANPTESP